MAEVQHSFTKGMNRDISKDKFPHDAYYYLLNGRIMNDDSATLSDIINIKGNTNANINNNSLSRTNYSIIGYCTLQNDIILFYASNTATGVDSLTTYSIIDRLIYQGNNAYLRDELWNGQGLNFRIDKPIRAVARYESSNVEKIYWVDDNNLIRQANIADSSLSTYSVDQFDIIGNIDINDQISFIRYTTGELKPGSIGYSYRLVKKNGYKTNFVPPLYLIPIGNKINLGSQLDKVEGNDIYDPETNYNSGKGVEIEIILDPTLYDYDYIEVISLWYSSKTAIPDINIISKTEFIPRFENRYLIIDTGTNSYGTLTYAEFLSQQGDFIAKDIVSKDNRLFIANIQERYFDLDLDATWTGKTNGSIWDSRAYRFDSGQKCELLNAPLTTVEYTLDGSTTPNYASVPETADAVNIYNNITETTTNELNTFSRQQKFKSNGTTLGGSGLNISYTFGYGNSNLYTASSADPSLSGSLTAEHLLGTGNSSSDNGNMGFQRNEVYRFGIVFFDEKGRQSFVKWIGDIRIPPLADSAAPNNYVSYEDSSNVYRSVFVQPSFDVSNVPTIKGVALRYKIVYVQRTEADKGVVMAGLIQPTIIESTTSRASWFPYNIGDYDIDTPNTNPYLINFISPEINFRYTESFDIDFIEVTGQYTSENAVAREATVAPWGAVSVQYAPNTTIYDVIVRQYPVCTSTSDVGRVAINDYIKSVPPTSVNFTTIIGSTQYKHYSFRDTGSGNTTGAKHGTCITCELAGALPSTAGNANYFYGYARKKVFESQYGGLSYEARQSNVYTNPNVYTCPDGDTYSTIFEYGNFFTNDDSNVSKTYSEFIYLTCESSINCVLRHGDTFSRKYTSAIVQPTRINEDPYLDIDTGITYTGMYSYNNAYSAQNTATKYYPKPHLFEQINTQSTRIKYSDLKIENEDIDSWLSFRANNYKDANENYGEINKLYEFNDKIFYFQNNATGILSVNPRVTQQSIDGVTIVLGTGEVIDKFYYLSTDIGCQDNSDIVGSFSAIYWLDKNKKKIYTFNGQIESITDLKGMFSYLKNNVYESSSFIGSYDVVNSEVLMTIRDTNPKTEFVANLVSGTTWDLLGVTSIIEIPFVVGRVYKIGSGWFTYVSKTATSYRFTFSHGTTLVNASTYDLSTYITERDNFTLAYNEKAQCFTSFYSFIPSLYIYHARDYFTSVNNRDLYQHNIGDGYNTFYGTTYPTTLKLITNFGSQIQSEYTNIHFFAEVWNDLGELIPNATISNISLKDSEQKSDDIILYPMHLPNDSNRSRYVLDTSSLRIGLDWYTGKVTPPEGLVVYNNELYRNIAITNQNGPPVVGANWAIAELCNIRKTVNHWMTQLPRCFYRDNNTNDYNYSGSNRFRSNWLEVTLEFKDMMPGIDLADRRLRLSDIKLIYTPMTF